MPSTPGSPFPGPDTAGTPHVTLRGDAARRLAARLRSARVTVLLAAAGDERTALLVDGVLPALGRRAPDRRAAGAESDAALHDAADTPVAGSPATPAPGAERRIASPAAREVVVYWDRWGASPLPPLRAAIAAAVGVADEPVEGRLLAAWLRDVLAGTDTRLLLVLDGFDEALHGAHDRADLRRAVDQWRQVSDDDTLPVHTLVTLRDEHRTLLRPLALRLDDTALWRLGTGAQLDLLPPEPDDQQWRAGLDDAMARISGFARTVQRPLRKQDLLELPAAGLPLADGPPRVPRPKAPRVAAPAAAPSVAASAPPPSLAAPAKPLPVAAPVAAPPNRPDAMPPTPAPVVFPTTPDLWAEPPTPPEPALAPPALSGPADAADTARPPPPSRPLHRRPAVLAGIGAAVVAVAALVATLVREPAPVVASAPSARGGVVPEAVIAAAPPAAITRPSVEPLPTVAPPAAPAEPASLVIDLRLERDARWDTRLQREFVQRVAAPAGITLRFPGATATGPGSAGSPTRLSVERHDLLQAAAGQPRSSPRKLVAPLFTEDVLFLVRAASPLRWVHQVDGRRLDLGPAGGSRAATGGRVVRRVLGRAPSASLVSALPLDTALTRLREGRGPEVVVVVAPLPSAAVQGAFTGLRALSLDRRHPSTKRVLQAYLPSTVAVAGRSVQTVGVMNYLVAPATPAAAAPADRLLGALCRALPTLRSEGHPKWQQAAPARQFDAGWPWLSATPATAADCAAADPAAVGALPAPSADPAPAVRAATASSTTPRSPP